MEATPRKYPQIISSIFGEGVAAIMPTGDTALSLLERIPGRTSEEDLNYAQLLVDMRTPEAYQKLVDYFIDRRPSYVQRITELILKLDWRAVQNSDILARIESIGKKNFPLPILENLVCKSWDWRLWENTDLMDLLTENQKKVMVEEFYSIRQSIQLDLFRFPIDDLSPLYQAYFLEDLFLNCTFVSDLSPLSHLNRLEVLGISDTLVEDLSPLTQIPSLRMLFVSNARVTDFSPFEKMEQLILLNCSSSPIEDLSVLSGMTELSSLYLVDTNVKDLTPLAHLSNLQRLDINKDVDITPLRGKINLGLEITCW